MNRFYSVAILVLSIALIAGGSYLVLSASATTSMLKMNDSFRLFGSHLSKVGLGIVLMGIVAFVPFEKTKQYNYLFFAATIITLILVFVIGVKVKGASRWLNLYFISFQPTDLAKFTLVIFLATYYERIGNFVTELKEGYMIPLGIVGGTTLLIFAQPNVSNSILILTITFMVMFFAGTRIKYLAISAGGMFGVLLIAFATFHHARQRIMSHIGAVFGSGEYSDQLAQAIRGLGSGGFLGRGVGESFQRHLFLPEAYGDFIFAILGEELGMFGTVLVLLVYTLIFVFGVLIAKNCTSRYGQLLAFGISISIYLSALVNMAVCTGLLPVTGIPLPLVSLGGTSMLITCIEIGILFNIGIRATKDKEFDLVNQSEGAAIDGAKA